MFRNQTHPPLSVAISLLTDEGRGDLQRALDALIPSGPIESIQLSKRQDTYELLGFDELEMESFCAGLIDTRSIQFGSVRIAYLETILKSSEAEGKYIRQTGGSGNYGHCWLRVEPNEPGKGYEFINDSKGAVPKKYVEPIVLGVHDAMKQGVLAGYQMVDIKVTLISGSSHELDSNDMAFKFAGAIAFKEAARKASPVLLEPIMAVEVPVPEEHLGAIIGDINSRRGLIEGVEPLAGLQVIKAIVPLAELLRSSSRGRPDYAMEFAGYQIAPRLHGSDDAMGVAVRPRGPRPPDKSSSERFAS